MRKDTYVPLPELTIEEYGIEFRDLAFPMGFDEERIKVNIDAVRRTTRMAGIGFVAVRGAAGPKSDFTPNVSGVSSQGTASLGASLMHRKEKLINGVAVIPREVEQTWRSYDEPPLIDMFRYAPTLVEANVSERDERLRTDTRLKRGLMDPEGHAKFLNSVVSNGLREAAKQRYEQRPGAKIDKFLFYGLGGFYGARLVLDPVAGMQSVAIVASIWGAVDVLMAGLYTKYLEQDYKDAQFSIALNQDRRLASYVLTKTQKFVKAEK